MKPSSKRRYILLAVILTALLFVVVILIWPYLKAWVAIAMDGMQQERLLGFLDSFGHSGIPVLIVLQALQIVVAFLPGGIVEVMGGMLYGQAIGAVIGIVGILLGTAIAFWISKRLGRPVVQKLVSAQAFAKYERVCGDRRFELLTLFLFFLPGVPKDVLIYVIGTGSTGPRLTILATIARIPSIVVSVYAGSLFGQGEFLRSIVLYGIFMVVGVFGIVLHNMILKRLDKH